MQTLTGTNGASVDVLKITENNPYLSKLLKQTDPALNAMINAYGCTFMSSIAFPQLLTGTLFDADQITQIWDDARATPFASTERNPGNWAVEWDARVRNPDILTDIAFNQFAADNPFRDRLGVGFGGNRGYSDAVVVGNRTRVESAPFHYIVTDSALKVLYDPYSPSLGNRNPVPVGVYGYGKSYRPVLI